MFDLLNGLAAEADGFFKGIVTFVAAAFFVINSAKGGWALARIIGSALAAALVVAIVWALPLLAAKVKTDISAPAIVVTADPASPSTIVHI